MPSLCRSILLRGSAQLRMNRFPQLTYACLLGFANIVAAQTTNPCPANARFGDPAASPSWNGWGSGIANTRFQDQKGAGIAAADVPKLKLKWAFGFPGVKSVYGQPSVVAGRVFVGVDTGAVYSLDAGTGCVYWTFQAESGVRTSVSIEHLSAVQPTRYAAYFGDGKANAYAVDAATGQQIWKVHVEDHASAKITGAPKVFEGRVYIPVSSGEEGAGPNKTYPCCTSSRQRSRAGRGDWQASLEDLHHRRRAQAGREKFQRRAAIRPRGRRRVEFANHRSGASRALHRNGRRLHGPGPRHYGRDHGHGSE